MKMSKRKVVTHYPFTAEACAKEIIAYEKGEPDPNSRGAYISAAKRKYYAEVKIGCVNQLGYLLDLDVTPTLAKNLMVLWFGSAVSKPLLFKHFGIPGRTASDKSADLERQQELGEEYREQMRERMDVAKFELKRELAKSKGGK